ncbi:hypothetical protein [Pseudoramibacter alactolyticus]
MGNAYKKWQRQENRTDKAIAEKPLHESFLENVKRYQDKTALVWNDEKILIIYRWKMIGSAV